MFEAQYLFAGRFIGEAYIRTEVFSPWMPRQGDNVIIRLETLVHETSVTDVACAAQLFHKNSEEVGPGTLVSGVQPTVGATRTAPGVASGRYSGVKELVRYKFLVASVATKPADPDPNDYVLFRMLSPVWFDDVAAN